MEKRGKQIANNLREKFRRGTRENCIKKQKTMGVEVKDEMRETRGLQ
jgi:hypothetical protein